MSLSHQRVKQAWKHKKRGNTAAQISAHAPSSEQCYMAHTVYVVFTLGQYCVPPKRKTSEEGNIFGFFF